MISFSIPRTSAERLARIHHACSVHQSPATDNIGVRIVGNMVRFTATNGKILASIAVTVTDLIGSDANLVLGKEQFANGLKAALKIPGNRIGFKIDTQEARICNAGMESVVRILDSHFPHVDHVWTRPASKHWVPCIASLDQRLTEIASKIAGNKQGLLFSSAIDSTHPLERIWAKDGDEAVCISSIRALTRAPAYWSDGDLALFIMPVHRADSEPQLDLSAHTMAQETAAIAA